LAAGVALLVALPHFLKGNPYIINVFILIFYMSTISMAWNLLGGMTGQNSLGHAAFMGLGAYISTLFVVKTGGSPWVGLLLAIVLTGLIAAVVFYPCFILRGPYFTLVTIAFGEAVRQCIINWDYAGKAMGIALPFGRDSLRYFRFMSKIPYYYAALLMLAGTYLLMKKIDNSKLGFALKTIREDEDVAASIGIKPLKYKVAAVVISSMIAAMVGFFYASYNRYIDPDLMMQAYSVEFVLPAIVGGAAFVEGPLIGGFLLISVSEYLRNKFGGVLPGINLILYAIILLVVIRFRPTGILGWYHGSNLSRRVDFWLLGRTADAEESDRRC
jgi:branched-chain amino acid transport system permease protein